MKKTPIALALMLICTITLNAQVAYDSIGLNTGYTNISFYSLQNGEQVNTLNTDWDIAFDASLMGNSIRLNSQKGNTVYTYPNGPASDWSIADTAGIGTWTPLYNSDTTWAVGAFNAHANYIGGIDVGWGVYNTITHYIIGDSLYIIKLDNGDLKKIEIKQMANKVYSFRYANLDGSALVDTIIDKNNYPNKKFIYLSLQSNVQMDKEPIRTDWDIAFAKYSAIIAPSTTYPVVGVLHNSGVKVAKAATIANPRTITNYAPYPFLTAINTIGYNWKSYNTSTNMYDIQDSLAYFIKDMGGNIWRLVLTGFEGTTTGKIIFEKEKLAYTTSVNEINIKNAVAFYPNPVVQKRFHIVFDTGFADDWGVNILDLNGRIIRTHQIAQQGFIDYQLDLSELRNGTYLVQLFNSTTGFQKTEKILVNQ